MNVTAQKFQSSYAPVYKSLARSNHRTTLPQSALAGCQLPQRGSREGVRTTHPTARKPERCGRFSSPLRNSEVFTFHHSSGDTPSVSLSLDSSLREGAGDGLCHSTGCLRNRKVTGDFHRPYETQKILAFTTHRRTLPQSASLTAPSGREPGGVRTIQRAARKPQDFGRFSSPLRNSEDITLYHCRTIWG